MPKFSELQNILLFKCHANKNNLLIRLENFITLSHLRVGA